MDSVSVFHYTDYRLFLKEALAQKLRKSSRLSMRSLAAKAGINSPNYLQRVIAGKPVGAKMAEKLSRIAGLRGSEEKYFRLMIEFSEEKSSEQKKAVLLKLLHMRSKAQGKLVAAFDNDIRKEWYLIVIWEMAAVPGICLSPEVIVAALGKGVTLAQAEKGLEFLLERQYLTPTGEPHRYVQGSLLLHSTDEIESVLLRNIHRKFITMSLDHLDSDLDQRTFQGLTIAVNEASFQLIKKEIKTFIHELAERYSMAADGDRIARVNMQFFPLTKVLRRDCET